MSEVRPVCVWRCITQWYVSSCVISGGTTSSETMEIQDTLNLYKYEHSVFNKKCGLTSISEVHCKKTKIKEEMADRD